MLEFDPILDETRSHFGCKQSWPVDAMSKPDIPTRCCVLAVVLLVCASATALAQQAQNQAASPYHPQLELSRAVRPWEFLCAVGGKAGVFGHESGTVEAWVYPMKIVRDLQLVFRVGDRAIPAESLARTLTARPEAVTVTYAGDAFSVQETFFVPRNEPGAIIALDVNSYEPIDVEVRFRADFQLMWPAALGGTYVNWDEKLHAFSFGEEQKKWFALLGSPSGNQPRGEYETNYSASEIASFRLGKVAKGRERKLIVLAGSVTSAAEVEQTYQRLANSYDDLRRRAAAEYAGYLQNTTSLLLPDADVQRAYDWARVSVLQGLVTNPFLGTGLVAGYRTSGTGTRPGFAWFFGRDSLWTSLALDSEGDFSTTRTALQFLMKYQRDDGKVEHEISQSAAQVPWFKNYPYAYASADATPLLLISADEYVRASGDTAFARDNWDHLWRAYQFLRSTWDRRGLPQNAGVGHGWVEGGPLLPVKSEFYQSGLGVEALQAVAELARISGHGDLGAEAEREFRQHQAQLNELFWSPEHNFFAFAVDQQDRRLETPSVLTTVPMWFGVTDEAKSQATITQLASADHMTDWGMRIMSARDPRFDPSGYHFGSVWPLFTGWASVGEYRYHRPLPAWANLRANALLALNGSAGHVTEVLSGAFFEPLSTSSPHQIWSSAMVISPLLRGTLGLQADATHQRLRLTPHAPGDWTWWKARHVRVGSGTLDLAYNSAQDLITLDVTSAGTQNLTLDFSPAISPNAKVLGVEVDGAPAKYKLESNATDQHVVTQVALSRASTSVRIRLRDTFSLVVPSDLPELGGTSRNLKVVSESWSPAKDAVTYALDGLSAQQYELGVRGSAPIRSVEGAELIQTKTGPSLRVRVPAGNPSYQKVQVTIHFGS